MSQPTHTPGPVIVSGTTIQAESPARYIGVVGAPSERGPEDLANAHLLAAAYNAFDSAARKLGCNAVKLAEWMEDGEIAELFIQLSQVLAAIEATGECLGDMQGMRDILAKVKGGAT